MTNQQYETYIQSVSPKSRVGVNTAKAFCVGGAICALGEGLRLLYLNLGMEEKLTAGCVPVSLIFLAALLTALHVFDDLGKFAGAGAVVPITGFSNAMVSPAIEYRSEGFIGGLAFKMFTISGPVLVYGISASVLYGTVVFVVSLFQR